jgi:hypothetical protein
MWCGDMKCRDRYARGVRACHAATADGRQLTTPEHVITHMRACVPSSSLERPSLQCVCVCEQRLAARNTCVHVRARVPPLPPALEALTVPTRTVCVRVWRQLTSDKLTARNTIMCITCARVCALPS